MKKRRSFVLILLVVGVGCATAGAATPRPAGTWSGTFALPAGSEPVPVSVEVGDGSFLAALDVPGQRTALLLDEGRVHLLSPREPGTYAVGSGLSTSAPSLGQATFAAGAATWLGLRAERVPLRQEAVRVGVLACTLTIPPGGGRRAAVAFAHGAGPALRIPALWLFGGVDKTVPTRLCVERLEPVAREPGRDFSYAVFPAGGHGLVETANGLLAEQARSDRFVPGLHTTIAEWLRARGVI